MIVQYSTVVKLLFDDKSYYHPSDLCLVYQTVLVSVQSPQPTGKEEVFTVLVYQREDRPLMNLTLECHSKVV